jgi:transcriptional regulator with XRE-family HTH domain
MDKGSRLKNARKQIGFTQDKLAKSIGLKQANIRDLESGKVKISTLHALALEHVHNLNAQWLLTGEGEMFFQKGNFDKETTAQKPANKKEKASNIVELEHMELVKKFKDKAKGKRYNEQLIEIEQLNQVLFDNVGTIIESTLNSAKIMSGEETEDRRKKQDPWEGEERRKDGTNNQ